MLTSASKIFIHNLKLILKERGISQYKLSKEIGISPASLSGYLRGKYTPKLEHAYAICKTLNLDLGTICSINVDPYTKEDMHNAVDKDLSLQEIIKNYLKMDNDNKNEICKLVEV